MQIVDPLLIKTGVVRCYDLTVNNNVASEQVTRPGNHHLLNMLPLNHKETKEENLARRKQIRGSRPDFQPSTPNEDTSMKFPVG